MLPLSNLLADLEQFVRDHRPHVSLTADATAPAWNGYRLTVACTCGVVFERWVTSLDAELDLLRAASLKLARSHAPKRLSWLPDVQPVTSAFATRNSAEVARTYALGVVATSPKSFAPISTAARCCLQKYDSGRRR
jgi:hypothetical protein